MSKTIRESVQETVTPPLKPCPFCGGKAAVWRTNYDTYVECENYHVDKHRVMISAAKDSDAFDAWNTRYNP